jgi:hypothetical protein
MLPFRFVKLRMPLALQRQMWEACGVELTSNANIRQMFFDGGMEEST